MLACRACRVPMSASEGCALCNTMRRNMVTVGETEDERPSLAVTGNEALVALRGQIEFQAGILKRSPLSDKARNALIGCTNALSKLVGELRKLQDDGQKTIAAMTFEERARLFVGWYTDLPPPSRLSLREKMADHEAKIAQPVPADAREPVLS